MNYLTVERSNKTPVNSVALSSYSKNDEIVLTVPKGPEAFSERLSLVDPSEPLLSRIKNEWYYKKIVINLTDRNEILLVKLAIKQTKKDLKRIMRKINTVERQNNEVVPKRLYNLLERKYDHIALDLIYLKKGFVALNEQYVQLEVNQLELIAARDKLFNENERTRVKLTPRPDWSKWTSHYSVGAKQWESLMKSLTSNELVDVVLNEFIGGNDGTNEKHFLQNQTKTFENMKLQRRDVLVLIREILQEKASYDDERLENGLERELLKNFIRVYFLKRFKSQNASLRWCCNLIESVERLSFDKDCLQFLAILNGTVDEDLYHYFKKVSLELLSLCESNITDASSVYTDQVSVNELQVDTLSVNTASRQYRSNVELQKPSLKISKNSFMKILKQQFPDITTSDVRSLVAAAKIDLINNTRKHKHQKRNASFLLDDLFEDFELFDFSVIFHVKEDGALTEFLTKLKEYILKERNRYILKLLRELIDSKRLAVTEGSIKVENLENTIVAELPREVEAVTDTIAEKVKLKKKKSKTKKRKLKSKLRVFLKKTMKTKKTLINKPLEAHQPANIQKSKSMDSITLYDVDILDNRLYTVPVSVDELKTCLLKIDPEMSASEVQRHIDWVFNKPDSYIKCSEIHLGRLLRELQKFSCHFHN